MGFNKEYLYRYGLQSESRSLGTDYAVFGAIEARDDRRSVSLRCKMLR